MIKLTKKEFEKFKNNLYDIKDAANELNIKFNTLYSYLTKTPSGFHTYLDPISTISQQRILITKHSIKQFKFLQNKLTNDYYTTSQLTEKYPFSSQFWRRGVNKYKPEGVICARYNKKLYIPKEFVQSYILKKNLPNGFISTTEIVKLLGITDRAATYLRNKGDFGKTITGLTSDKKVVAANHRDKVLEFKQKVDKEVKFLNENNYISSKEVIELFPYDVHKDTIIHLFSNKKFDTIYKRKYSSKFEPVNYTTRDSVLRYIHSLNDYRFSSATEPLDIFMEGLQTLNVPVHLSETVKIYKDYCLNKLSQSKASKQSLVSLARTYIIRIQNYFKYFKKELMNYTDEELKWAFSSEQFNQSDKTYLVDFLNHLSSIKDTKYKNRYTKNSSNKFIQGQEKEIYEIDQFINYYYYVRSYEKHCEKAIESRDYAITWLYVAIHLTNGWRHGDVIKLPKINIEKLGITDLNWFRNNKLTDDQSNQILAQIDKHRTVRLIVSKTKFRRTFFVNKSLRIPMATAYAIAQIHSDNEEDNVLINFKTKFNIPYEKPFNLFFANRKDLANFSSLKMNRSLVEHFYYSIYKKTGYAYSAYEYAKRIRQHKVAPNKVFSEITQIYIRKMNEDGPIDDIVVELFERGEFGYLYSLLFEGAKDKYGNKLAVTTQTKLIKEIKDKYPPITLEGLAKFIRNRQIQKETLAIEIVKQPKENLLKIIDKLFLGELPSKHKDYNCITYPNCHNPNSESCSGCLLAIPRASLMQSLKDEIDEKIDSLLNSNSWGSVIRDYSVIYGLLERLNEASTDLSKSYVGEYIDLDELEIRISKAIDRVQSVKRLYQKGE